MPLAPRDEWFESIDGYIHRGYCFSLSHKNTNLASAGVYKYLLKSIDGRESHLDLYTVSSTGSSVLVELLEAPTVSNNGTLLTARNRLRSSLNVPVAMAVYAGATASNDGTLLEATRSTGGNKAGSVDFGDRSEWILKDGVDYLIRVTNEDNSSANTILNLVWYEEQ